METQFGRVGDLKAVQRTTMGYILENGVEIEDTFAEMLCRVETSPANSLF